jgi:hypothetical protein
LFPTKLSSKCYFTPIAAYNKITRAGDLSVNLSIDPLQPGINTFLVILTSAGKPVIDAKNVSLEFTNLSGMVPAAKAPITVQANGAYTQEMAPKVVKVVNFRLLRSYLPLKKPSEVDVVPSEG